MNTDKAKLNKANKIGKMVSDELLRMGLSYSYIGTHHVHDAIVLAVNEKLTDYPSVKKFVGVIVGRVAKKYGIDSAYCFKSIALSIERAFIDGDADYLLEIFKNSYNYDKGAVTNATFIMTVAEMIKNEMQEEEYFNTTQLRILIQNGVESITDVGILGSLYGIVQSLERGALV